MKAILKSVMITLCLLAFSSTMKAQCNNTSLGNNWTCVDGNANFAMGGSNVNIALANSSAINAGDTILYCFNSVTTQANGNNTTFVVTDNVAGNTYTQWPVATVSFIAGFLGDGANGSWSCFYVLNSQAKASGFSLNNTGQSGAWTPSPAHINDHGIIVLRNSGGPASGIDTVNGIGTSGTVGLIYTNNATSASGTCPCLAANQSITTSSNGEVILVPSNEGGTQDTFTAGWTLAPSSSFTVAPFVYFFMNTQATAGVINFSWTDTTPSDAILSAMIAFKPPSGVAPGGVIFGPTKMLVGTVLMGFLFGMLLLGKRNQ